VLALLEAIVGAMLSAFRLRANLVAENLVLRQRLAVLKVGRRPRLRPIDRAFWATPRSGRTSRRDWDARRLRRRLSS